MFDNNRKFMFSLSLCLAAGLMLSVSLRAEDQLPVPPPAGATDLRAADVQQRRPVYIHFDGMPLFLPSLPDFACLDNIRKTWIKCQILPVALDRGEFSMPVLPPGTYTLRSEINANFYNPAQSPGDYVLNQSFVVTEQNVRGPLFVDAVKLIHIRKPFDNARPLEKMLTGTVQAKPSFSTGAFNFSRKRSLRFAWDSVVDGAEYEYWASLVVPDSGRKLEAEYYHGKTKALAVDLDFAPTPANRYVEFRVVAVRAGRPVGEVYILDSGVQSWVLRFTIRDGLVWLPWALGGLMVVVAAVWLLAGRKVFGRKTTLAVVLLLLSVSTVVSALFWLRLADVIGGKNRARVFAAEWQAAVPRPDWWSAAELRGMSIDTLGDLNAWWRSVQFNNEVSEKLFYKRAYQAIVDHPGDRHLCATALGFMASVWNKNPDRNRLLDFWLEHFFDYRQRTDVCLNCSPGDMTAGMVQTLAWDHSSSGEHQQAVELIGRLIEERGGEISQYLLVRLYRDLVIHSWNCGQREAAIQFAQAGLLYAKDQTEINELQDYQTVLGRLKAAREMFGAGERDRAQSMLAELSQRPQMSSWLRQSVNAVQGMFQEVIRRGG